VFLSFSFKSSCIKIQRKRERIIPCDGVSINRSLSKIMRSEKEREERRERAREKREERERERERHVHVYVDSKKLNTIVK
jgi:hypothetical protein